MIPIIQQTNGRVHDCSQAAYEAADAARHLLTSFEQYTNEQCDGSEPKQLVNAVRAVFTANESLIDPRTLPYVEAVRENLQNKLAISRLLSSIGQYVPLVAEKSRSQPRPLDSRLTEGDLATSSDGESSLSSPN